MPTEHKNIPDAQLHEPKGAASATTDQVYHSDGAGSGVWKKTKVEGVESATVDQIYIADGAGSANWQDAPWTTPTGGDTLIDEASIVDQTPTGPDAPLLVNYGNSLQVVSADGKVELDTDGTFRFTEDGTYVVTTDFNLGRTGSTGTSELILASKLGFGSTPTFDWVPWSVERTLSNAAERSAINRTIHFTVDSNVAPLPWAVRIYILRNSSGQDAGGLVKRTPVLQSTEPTLPDVPSARLTILTNV